MPSRNILKIDIENSFYHVYVRGHNGQPIFRDDEDYNFFLNLFDRYLTENPHLNPRGKSYLHLWGEVEIICYCLIASEVHLLLYQKNEGSMSRLMKGILMTYSRYYHKRYGTSGSLFESRYKASRIATKKSLIHISRYIHLVSDNWQAHPYSSIHAYYGIGQQPWLMQKKLTSLFPSLPHYADFLDDAAGYRRSLPHIKNELANNIIIK